MDFKTIMKNWRKKVLNEFNRSDFIDIATSDGGDPNTYFPPGDPRRGFIAHNYRTNFEIEDGTITLDEITDNGVIVWSIVPFDNQRKVKYGTYDMYIHFVNWDSIVTSTASTRDKTLALLKNVQGQTDDIKYHCDCPSFRYHYNYVADQIHGAAIMPEPRPANIRNPGNRGAGCKHIRRMVERVPYWYSDVYYKIKDIEERLKQLKQQDDETEEEPTI